MLAAQFHLSQGKVLVRQSSLVRLSYWTAYRGYGSEYRQDCGHHKMLPPAHTNVFVITYIMNLKGLRQKQAEQAALECGMRQAKNAKGSNSNNHN